MLMDGDISDQDVDMVMADVSVDSDGDADGVGGSLSMEQTEKVIQFQEITGLNDLGRCRALLERQEWRLEDAVQEHLGLGDSVAPLAAGADILSPGSVNGPRLRQPRPAVHSSVPMSYAAAAVGPNVPMRPPRAYHPNIPENGYHHGGGFAPLRVIRYVLSLPLSLAHSAVSTVWGIVAQILNTLFFDPIAFRRTNPRDDVVAFVEHFRRTYAPAASEANMPPFVQSGYRQALDQAKRELKFLVVYLHSEEHQDTRWFCRESFCHPGVVELLRNGSALIYGCSVSSPDGYGVSQIMRECTYPFVALVCLKNNQMTIVERLEGALPPDKFLAFLRNGINGNEIHLTAARLQREELNAARELRAQQDLAYQESLERDRERQREQQAIIDAARREEERKALIQRQKTDFVSRIPQEPMIGTASVFTLNVMLPNGQRLIRRFLPDQKLSVLFYFVFCHPDSPEEFDLVTSYPKRTIPCRSPEVPVSYKPHEDEIDHGLDTGFTFSQFQLTSSQVIRVIDLEA